MQSRAVMQAFVVDLLKKNLPPFYYYHNYEHTLYVMDKVALIAREEHCSARDIDLLETAALWHDTGFIHVYSGHEKASCLLARKYLPGYGYSETDTETICGMIMATRIPQSPQTRLQAILADADLEYLGTAIVYAQADRLCKELQHRNPALTNEQWQKTQVSFLEKHRYFTGFCKANREALKDAYRRQLVAASAHDN
ncbi:MAG: HD domain-containing protein [Chitinophagaceae bacterium]